MQKITIAEATSRLKKVAETHLPAGARIDARDEESFTVRCELAWGVDANVRVSPWLDEHAERPTLKPHVVVTWSSSGLAPAAASAAAHLHTEMAGLACLLEAVIVGLPKIKRVGET